MKAICSYCQQEKDVESFEHPLTFQVNPTCSQCKNKLLSTPSYDAERKILAKTGCLTPALLILSIIFLIFGNSAVGLWGIIISLIIGAISFFGLEYFVKKRDKNYGFDPTKYIWCKTCKNFRKVKNWDYTFSQSKKLLNASEVPCKIYNQTKEVWGKYFNLPSGDRKLYPDDCSYWAKK
jgi:hypothetical protein